MKKLICIGLCCTLFLMTGCGHKVKLSNGKEVVADFDGKSITINELYEEMKFGYARDVLMEMVDVMMLDKKYPTDAQMVSDVEYQIAVMKQQLGVQYLDYIKTYYGANNDEEAKPVIAMQMKRMAAVNDYVKTIITDKEINDYYSKEIVGDIKASHILIKPNVTDSMEGSQVIAEEAKALTLAKEIIAKLDKGEKFADLAKQYSNDDANKNKGGDLGYFNKGVMDTEFEKAAYALNKDAYSKTPVKSQFGYHIILKVDQKDKPALNDTVKNQIISSLSTKKLEEDPILNYKALIELRKTNKLKIYDTELKKQYDSYIDQKLTTPTE